VGVASVSGFETPKKEESQDPGSNSEPGAPFASLYVFRDDSRREKSDTAETLSAQRFAEELVERPRAPHRLIAVNDFRLLVRRRSIVVVSATSGCWVRKTA
jgi:hypothetical protein